MLLEDVTPQEFTISEVASMLGVSSPTLRWWESRGLVKPERSSSGHRIYRDADIQRLKEIYRLRMVEQLNLAAIIKQLGPPTTSSTSGEHSDDRPETPGRELKRLRRRSGKTLNQAATDSGLSASFISAVERGDSGASVASLRQLLHAYGTQFSEVFKDTQDKSSWLVGGDERPVMALDDGVYFEGLAVTERAMDPTILHVPPRRGSGGFYSHSGEEFVHIIEGILFVEIQGQETFRLNVGDTLYFPSHLPHRWWAEAEGVRAFYVNTPPSL